MSARKVSAGNGIGWLSAAVQLLLKNPAPFAMMGLVMAVAGIVPILGSLALGILGPALYGGIATAARTQSRDGSARFEQLFQVFQQEGKLGPMLVLCLPGIIGGVLAVVLLVILVAVVMAGAGVSSMTDSATALWGSLGIGGLVMMSLILVLAVVVFMLTFFAIPAVMFNRIDAIEAMRQSLRASLANLGALLLYLLALMLAALVLALLLSVLSSYLAQLLVSVLLFPVIGASMYLAWKDVFGETTEELPVIEGDGADGGGMVA